ncbi:MAG: RtcB family protein [Gammaproteobacteria bacterium]|nr:RtcB family protein [Gammaproteobacteria bacterium]
MTIKHTIEGGGVPVHVWTDDADPQALGQLANVASMPFVHHHVAAMPDVHVGIGATVGAVIPTHGAIIPAAVGVDIGCGMIATRLSLTADDLPDSLKFVRGAIESRVPVGFDMHEPSRIRTSGVRRLHKRRDELLERIPELAKMQRKPDAWQRQMGTLGGGNHFIEICLDEADRVWVMLHSGSRGIGNRIGQHFIARAREEMLGLDVRLPDRDLAYLTEGTRSFDDYVAAVSWAQDYAAENRTQILELVLDALRLTLRAFRVTDHAVNCHHNYVTREHHFGADVYVTRKGAIRANAGELGIIPGSMGAKSYIVRGKGNAQSFSSCSHGAGRRMSRGQAKKRFTERDLHDQTAGVECRKDAGVIDEIPGAYKDIDRVMADQTDLVEVVHTLKQIVCVKG